ncbi:ABC transporter substrate-binding protein [Capnocytophaga sputigena]|jgi:ABC transporter, substrate-binding protein
MKYLFPILIAFLLSACDNTPKKQANTAEKVTITDMAGRKVSVPKQINHAFIDRSSVHLIYALDTLLPVNRVFNYNESEKKYLKKGFYEGKPYVTGAPIEEIIKLHPDVILFTVSLQNDTERAKETEKANALQQKTKIPVVLFSGEFQQYTEAISLLGTLLHKEEKAKELNAFIEKYCYSIPKIVATIPANERKTIYYAEGMNGLQTEPPTSLHSYLINYTGGKNIAEVELLPGKGKTNVSIEQIYNWNPDMILVWSGNFDDLYSYKAIRQEKIWQQLRAVKENQVYQVPWRPFGWIDRPPGLGRVMGSIWLASLTYPNYFKADLVPITQEFFKKFYHYDMDYVETRDIIGAQPDITNK